METIASKSTINTDKVAQAFVRPIRVKGDPIEDPKPNKH